MRDAILLAMTGFDVPAWERRLHALAPRRDIRIWPDAVGDPADIAYACAWKPPRGLLAQFKNLRAIFSLGAGVDHLLSDPDLPDVPVTRIVNADLTQRMTEYVTLHVLMHHRRQRLYDEQQRERVWRDAPQPAASDVAVGLMGIGALGLDAADVLTRLGFRVAGWSRSPKSDAGIEMFHGAGELSRFLARTEILACLLPHTRETEGILNLALFRRLKRGGMLGGAYLINVGRGALQIDTDIIAALDEGSLAGATLDVFPTEPLPLDSPLWRHPKVTITPHNAAVSDPDALAVDVVRQIEDFERGLPLRNVVNLWLGY